MWWVAEQAEMERGNNKKNEADDDDKTPGKRWPRIKIETYLRFK
jgi:hypothetical protein